jgi:hypothetical protein
MGAMIKPTPDEIEFILLLEARGGEIVVQGEMRLLKIGRLVPEYVTQVSVGSDRGRFRLTEKGWELAETL